jgi:hypothetical protein
MPNHIYRNASLDQRNIKKVDKNFLLGKGNCYDVLHTIKDCGLWRKHLQAKKYLQNK